MTIRIPPIQVDKLESPVIRELPPPVIRAIDPPVVRPPTRPPTVDVPIEPIPSYEPIRVVPPAKESKPGGGGVGGGKSEKDSEELDGRKGLDAPTPPVPTVPQIPAAPPKRGTEIQVPFTDYSLPVPTQKEVTLAGTTAFAATGATLAGKSIVEYLLKVMKPVFKKLWLKAVMARKKNPTDLEIQQLFLFEHEPDMKRVVKILEKEQKLEEQRQLMDSLEQ